MKKERAKEITKTIIKGIFLAGGIVIASTSPYFLTRVIPKIIVQAKRKARSKKDEARFCANFSYLKNHGFIKIDERNGQIYISLTPEGKKKAGKYQIDDLEIKKPKKWDGKWRILIFDIKDKQRIKREALRGKIKELGLYQLQKSVWVHPHDFQSEIEMLRSFFHLTKEEVRIIIAGYIEEDRGLKNFFRLS
jgi:DNA-binding transcriptional regulator PaaX